MKIYHTFNTKKDIYRHVEEFKNNEPIVSITDKEIITETPGGLVRYDLTTLQLTDNQE